MQRLRCSARSWWARSPISSKKTLAGLENADQQNTDHIERVEEKLNDLKSDLPLVYVTREDYIRTMNRIEDKLDQILYGKLGKEE